MPPEVGGEARKPMFESAISGAENFPRKRMLVKTLSVKQARSSPIAADSTYCFVLVGSLCRSTRNFLWIFDL